MKDGIKMVNKICKVCGSIIDSIDCHGPTLESRIASLVDTVTTVGRKVDEMTNDVQDLIERVSLIEIASKGRLDKKVAK